MGYIYESYVSRCARNRPNTEKLCLNHFPIRHGPPKKDDKRCRSKTVFPKNGQNLESGSGNVPKSGKYYLAIPQNGSQKGAV